jgi:hypothetical protein
MEKEKIKEIDLSMWSPELQGQIRKTLKMGEDLMKEVENIKNNKLEK